MLSIAVTLAVRILLIALFLPFSALDKILNFGQAVDQASEVMPVRWMAVAAIATGFSIEVLMSLAVLTGVADRLASLILAAYCIAAAILWKRFWAATDFRLRGVSRGRDVFWDFLKNLAVAGGFLLIAVGPNAAGLHQIVSDPLSSTQPYAPAKGPG